MEKSYEKVVDHVQRQILNGVYCVGDKLPSERDMALQLNVSRTSVREGIRVLEQMGALSCLQGSGNYITGDFENKDYFENVNEIKNAYHFAKAVLDYFCKKI